MDDKTLERVNKEVQRTIKKASEEVRGRELTPQEISVRVRIRTKEGYSIIHTSNPADISPPAKK
jgi:hypothetical protein